MEEFRNTVYIRIIKSGLNIIHVYKGTAKNIPWRKLQFVRNWLIFQYEINFPRLFVRIVIIKSYFLNKIMLMYVEMAKPKTHAYNFCKSPVNKTDNRPSFLQFLDILLKSSISKTVISLMTL